MNSHADGTHILPFYEGVLSRVVYLNLAALPEHRTLAVKADSLATVASFVLGGLARYLTLHQAEMGHPQSGEPTCYSGRSDIDPRRPPASPAPPGLPPGIYSDLALRGAREIDSPGSDPMEYNL